MRTSRRRQLEVIASRLAETARSVIAGDFNEWRRDRGLEPLAQRYQVVSPGHSFHAATPMVALDRFAHTKDMVVLDAGVDTSTIARRASDHLPVWVEFAL
jgi:endonuclease/exonuclease/phosphatase family metal-dependent hydrolase